MKTKNIDIQGHRGCRGYFPENSIPAFIEAIDMGVHTLEMDVVISKDKKVVVSHEPFLSAEICTDTTGLAIDASKELAYNLYEMPYEQVAQYNCGIKAHPRFPEQKKINTIKPLLTKVIDSVEAYVKERRASKIRYNIEIKSTPEGDNVFHPAPQEFTDLVVKVLEEYKIVDRVTLQSFDIRTLQYIHEKYPSIQLAFLVENEDGVQVNLDRLGFIPPIYSCYYKLLNENEINICRTNKMLVIPWTVNDFSAIQDVLSLGVDGIISDYPDRVVNAVEKI